MNEGLLAGCRAPGPAYGDKPPAASLTRNAMTMKAISTAMAIDVTGRTQVIPWITSPR